MIFKQGSKYEEVSPETEEQPAAEEKPAAVSKFMSVKIKGIPLPAIVVGVVILFLIILLLVIPKSAGRDEPVEPTPNADATIPPDDYWDDFILEESFSYTAQELADLRAWGFTGDEIEEHEALETPAETLIAETKKAREELAATLANPESPEYQQLLRYTWLGEPALDLSVYTPDVANAISYTSHIINADYEKVPPHGHTLYLKVFLEDGSAVFMECSMPRYLELADSGNIVVRYQSAVVDDITIIHDMKEVTIE